MEGFHEPAKDVSDFVVHHHGGRAECHVAAGTGSGDVGDGGGVLSEKDVDVFLGDAAAAAAAGTG